MYIIHTNPIVLLLKLIQKAKGTDPYPQRQVLKIVFRIFNHKTCNLFWILKTFFSFADLTPVFADPAGSERTYVRLLLYISYVSKIIHDTFHL